jgi:putative hydrolase of the HAD superfamily
MPTQEQTGKSFFSIITEKSKKLSPVPAGVSPVLPQELGVKAVLFDIYGTLLISGSGDIGISKDDQNILAFEEAFAFAGFSTGRCPEAKDLFFKTIARHHEETRAGGILHPEVEIRQVHLDVLNTMAETSRLSDDFSSSWNSRFDELSLERQLFIEAFALHFELAANPVWPMPDAASTLESLAALHVPLGIVSNAQFYTPLTLEALLGKSLAGLGFDPDACAFSYALKTAKPAVTIFSGPLTVLSAKYGIAPSQVLYVGNDMKNDVWTSKEAGCKACAFCQDARSWRPRTGIHPYDQAEPDITITGLSQLLPYFSNQQELHG